MEGAAEGVVEEAESGRAGWVHTRYSGRGKQRAEAVTMKTVARAGGMNVLGRGPEVDGGRGCH